MEMVGVLVHKDHIHDSWRRGTYSPTPECGRSTSLHTAGVELWVVKEQPAARQVSATAVGEWAKRAETTAETVVACLESRMVAMRAVVQQAAAVAMVAVTVVAAAAAELMDPARWAPVVIAAKAALPVLRLANADGAKVKIMATAAAEEKVA